MNTHKIYTSFLRMILLTVYGIFFTVQLTTYFDHGTGSTYRLNNPLFHTSKAVKHIADGFSNSDKAGTKLTIRLNKKFYPQSAVLYTAFVSKAPVFSFTKKSTYTNSNPFADFNFLSDHSLRGPPIAV